MKLATDSVEYMDPAAPADITEPRYGNRNEHRKVRRMIRSLKKSGFRLDSLAIEGEGYIRVATEREAVCEVFEWDAYVTMRFRKDRSPRLYGVLLVQGNGEDIIADYTYDGDGAGTFAAAMQAFTDADERREV